MPLLWAQEVPCERDALFTFLRQQQQLVPRKRSYTKTIDLHHRFHYHLNLVKDALRPTVSNKLCVSDITYLPTHQSTVYLSLDV